jgi:hypothetical protein
MKELFGVTDFTPFKEDPSPILNKMLNINNPICIMREETN